MKRLALLLAAVGLGSGCVVSATPSPGPCGPQTLSIDWSFVDLGGIHGRTCAAVGVNDVDVYVDGVLEASLVPCTTYGVVLSGFATGAHDVMVEGFDLSGAIINRDWYTVTQGSCGDSYYLFEPGEGTIQFLPTQCSGGYLTYSLIDNTRAAPYVISSIISTSGNVSYPCVANVSGVAFPVPYGYYVLDWIEERTSTGTFLWAKCADTSRSVLASGLSSVSVSLTGTAACH